MAGLREDTGVSPVVGMVLVLGISIVGISAILYWGLPAIDEMKANVEHRSLQTQFQELNAAMQELIAGTTEKTAKRWQPAISRGSIAVQSGTEPWLFTVEPYVAGWHNDFVWKDLSDGNNVFTIHSKNNTNGNIKVEAYIVRGTTSLDTLNVTGGTAVAPAQMTGANLGTWNAGQQSFSVHTTGGAVQNLKGATFKFRIYSGSVLISEAWYVATGRVDYNLSAGLGDRGVVQNNGAVLTGDSRGVVLMQQPPIPPPTNTSGVTRVFARAVVLQGSESVGGENRYDLLVSLYSSATLASYDCSLYTTTRADCVEAVKIFNYGQYQQPWYNYLSNSDKGYRMAKKDVSSQAYLEHREGYLAFTLLESTLTISR